MLMSILLLPQVREILSRASFEEGQAPQLGRMLRFSLPFVATGVLNQIVWRQSEVLFLGRFHGPEASGFFNLAYQLPQFTLEFIPLTIWPLILAGTAEAYARKPGNLAAAIDLYYRLLYMLVIPVAAMGFAFSGALVPMIYGGEMAPAAMFAPLFFIVFSYSFIYTPLSMALYVVEKSWVNMLLFAILAVCNVGLDFALIPKYGLWGAFIPVALVLVLAVIIFSSAVRRVLPDIREGCFPTSGSPSDS
jgi:O-antigen/teichoic acid export membrane protein